MKLPEDLTKWRAERGSLHTWLTRLSHISSHSPEEFGFSEITPRSTLPDSVAQAAGFLIFLFSEAATLIPSEAVLQPLNSLFTGL